MSFKWLKDLLHPKPEGVDGAVRVFSGNDSPVTSLALTGGGRILLAATMSGGRAFSEIQPVAISTGHDLDDLGPAGSPLEPHEERDRGTVPVVSSPIRQWVGGAIEMWSLDKGECLHVFEGHRQAVRAVAADARGRRAVSAGDDGQLRLWDLKDRSDTLAVDGGAHELTSLAMTDDGSQALVGGNNGHLALWAIDDDRLDTLHDPSTEAGLGFESVCLDGESKLALTASDDGIVRVWDVESGRVRHKLYGHRGPVRSVAVSRDGGWASSGGADGTVTVWDVTAGRRLHDFPGHSGGVTAVAISSDGRTVVSGGKSGRSPAIRVWDVVNGACRLTSRRHRKAVSALRFTPDDQWVVSGSHDGTMHLWPLP